MLMRDLFREVEVRLSKDDATAALDMLQQALAVYPMAWSLRRALVRPLLSLGRTDEAEQAMSKALEIQPKDAEMWLLFGELVLKRNPETAGRAFRNALLFAPTEARVQELIRASGQEAYLHSGLRLAWLHLYQGMYDLALEEMAEAEAEDVLLARLGLLEAAWRRGGDLREAASIARSLLQVTPNLLPAVLVLAADAKERGSVSELEGWIRVLRDLDPDGSGTLASMGDFLAAHPLPELEGLEVDLPIQEPLAREDLEALEQLDQQLDAELMSLMVPEGHGLAELEELGAGIPKMEPGIAEPVTGAAVGGEAASETLEAALVREEVTEMQAPVPEVEAGHGVTIVEQPPEKVWTAEATTTPGPSLPEAVADLESELTTVREVLEEAASREASTLASPVIPNGLGRRIARASGQELEELLAQVRASRYMRPEVQHRLLAMTYRRMGLGLEAVGEAMIALRCRKPKVAQR